MSLKICLVLIWFIRSVTGLKLVKCDFLWKLWVCLKINSKDFVLAFDKAFVLHFLNATINLAPVGGLCILGSVLKSFWTQFKFDGNVIINYTVLKVFIFGVFRVRIFLHLGWIWRETPYHSVLSPNAGKYESEKLRIQTLFYTALLLPSVHLQVCKYHFVYHATQFYLITYNNRISYNKRKVITCFINGVNTKFCFKIHEILFNFFILYYWRSIINLLWISKDFNLNLVFFFC